MTSHLVYAAGTLLTWHNDLPAARAARACMACHSFAPARHMTGPSLAGVWGRKAGTVDGFGRYSSAENLITFDFGFDGVAVGALQGDVLTVSYSFAANTDGVVFIRNRSTE